ncbi:MAG: amino acid synthesis family protein [Pseudomonadota bacterium]
MTVEIRRTLSHVETTFRDGGLETGTPMKLIAATAVITNPWAGRGFVEDLRPEVKEVAPVLGRTLVDMVLEAAGGGEAVEGYGKFACAGTGGELEHAAAIIHYVPFGNIYREAVGAKTYLAFNNFRAGPGAPIMIPLMDKHDGGRRSHYQSVHLNIPDAPAPDEMIVALGASVGGRPHSRSGDRYQDLAEMGGDVDNPAGV